MDETKVYLASDIQKALSLGRSKNYQFLDEVYRKQEPFRVIKVGKLFRKLQKFFREWIDATKNIGRNR
ncbi:MAG: DNA-binding protein [Lachnospiraceae bacterium]|nr:DNA-binding protein [Lachnospiraceae bacterium]